MNCINNLILAHSVQIVNELKNVSPRRSQTDSGHGPGARFEPRDLRRPLVVVGLPQAEGDDDGALLRPRAVDRPSARERAGMTSIPSGTFPTFR